METQKQMRKTLKPLSKDRKMIVRNGNDTSIVKGKNAIRDLLKSLNPYPQENNARPKDY